ncbi:M28 family peptidase [Subsaxibacter sp. CAU 1640]|uniref:M28 family metallopeptidase n=1 Tax=Subsaxibacter sp. CAU 1640 TaxID=2933271 RepID=UPI002006653C|nr:M28 family peptidase [Subsaxibacter sp. CAU 1640]MCK7591852.1 M28 family peptidase [Subsaxibacter sp. CAU 1640]
MKNILSIVSILILVSCKSKVVETTETLKESDSKTVVITSGELRESVTYLASDELQGRDTGSEGIEKAAIFIEEKFKKYGVKPYFESYRDNYDAKGRAAFNVIGYVEGNDPNLKNEFIILGAHYDHIGFGKPVENDSIANGANDDASGTAAVLAMSRYFAAKKNNKRSILFTLYSGEEMGLLGSKHLAEKLKDANVNIYTMVNFEMIGVPMTDKDYDAYFTGFDLSNMAPKMNDYVGYNMLGLLPQAKEYQLFYRSDNYSFYKVFNRPCHAISTFDFTNYEYYHHVDDEADKMDYQFMASLVNKLIPAFETMSNTAEPEIKMNE